MKRFSILRWCFSSFYCCCVVLLFLSFFMCFSSCSFVVVDAAAAKETEIDFLVDSVSEEPAKVVVTTIPAECHDMKALLQSELFADAEQRRRDRKLWKGEENFRHPDHPDFALESPFPNSCNLPRVSIDDMSVERFESEFRHVTPVVITAPNRSMQFFASVTQRDVLLHCYGGQNLTLSTANQCSVRKFRSKVRDYVEEVRKPQDLSTSGDNTLYLFGDHIEPWWEHLFSNYAHPLRLFLRTIDREPALSFGMANVGTGVPLHTHGAVFAEMLHGKKRWFLAPPGDENKPRFDGNESVLRYAMSVLPTYTPQERNPPALWDCTIKPGEILWIPHKWWHSTFNIGDAVFISSFL